MTEVAVGVVDNRASVTQNNATIDAPQLQQALNDINLAQVYQPEVYRTLKGYGFIPVPYQSALSRKLTIQIVSLEYDTSNSGMFTGARITGVVEADAINGMVTYSRQYSGYTSTGPLGDAGTTEAVQRLLNQLFTQAMSDQQLMQFLAQ